MSAVAHKSVQAQMESAQAAFKRAVEQLAAIDTELKEKRRRADDLEARIKAATDSGDMTVPVRELNRELRELRDDIEDVLADRQRFENVREARERDLARVRIAAHMESVDGVVAEISEVASGMIAAAELIASGVKRIAAVNDEQLEILRGHVRYNSERAGVKPPRVPYVNDITRFTERASDVFSTLAGVCTRDGLIRKAQ